MDIIIEHKFIEFFENNYEANSSKREWQVLHSIFTEYTKLRLFLKLSDNDEKTTISDSYYLRYISNLNPLFNTIDDIFESYKNRPNKPLQTLIFTEELEDWFDECEKGNTYCFCIGDFEKKIKKILNELEKEIDLSNEESKFEWDYFSFLAEKTNFIFISDPYLIYKNETENEEKAINNIKENLLKLLKININPDKKYKVFILSSFTNISFNKIFSLINDEFQKIDIDIFLIKRYKYLEDFEFHDRILYSNYTLTKTGKGFNLDEYKNKTINSEVSTSSIFTKKTYTKHINHFKHILEYIEKVNEEKNDILKKTHKELKEILQW